MTESRIEEIKELIAEQKQDMAKAEGRIEDIEAMWKDDFNANSLEEAEGVLEKVNKELSTLEGKERQLTEEIEELLEEME